MQLMPRAAAVLRSAPGGCHRRPMAPWGEADMRCRTQLRRCPVATLLALLASQAGAAAAHRGRAWKDDGDGESSMPAAAEMDRLDWSKHGADWNQGSCGSRRQQSPVDFYEVFRPVDGRFSYWYADGHSFSNALKNDGRQMFMDFTGQGMGGITLPVLGGEQCWYNLKRIELKAKSEHTLRGRHAPLELQLVHQMSTIADPTYGPNLVIVSVFLDNPEINMTTFLKNHPELKEEEGENSDGSAAFLQQRQGGRLRGRRRQMPNGEVHVDDDDDDDVENAGRRAAAHEADMRIGGEAEIDFAHSLVGVAGHAERVELTRLQREEPDATGSAKEVPPEPEYSPPAPGQPGFNVMLQHFVAERPPMSTEQVLVNFTKDSPLQLGELLAGGTFFSYLGSETTPPCSETVTWLVRRESILASVAQVEALLGSLYNMSGGAGNYRTVMPLQSRAIQVLAADEKEPAPRPLGGPGAVYDDGREQKSEIISKDAMTVAKAAADYAHDLDERLVRAAEVHAEVIEGSYSTTLEPTTRPFMVKPPLDIQWAANAMGQLVKSAIKDAADKAVKQLAPDVTSLGMSYARQDLLRHYGFTAPPTTTLAPTVGPAGVLPSQVAVGHVPEVVVAPAPAGVPAAGVPAPALAAEDAAPLVARATGPTTGPTTTQFWNTDTVSEYYYF